MKKKDRTGGLLALGYHLDLSKGRSAFKVILSIMANANVSLLSINNLSFFILLKEEYFDDKDLIHSIEQTSSDTHY